MLCSSLRDSRYMLTAAVVSSMMSAHNSCRGWTWHLVFKCTWSWAQPLTGATQQLQDMQTYNICKNNKIRYIRLKWFLNNCGQRWVSIEHPSPKWSEIQVQKLHSNRFYQGQTIMVIKMWFNRLLIWNVITPRSTTKNDLLLANFWKCENVN